MAIEFRDANDRPSTLMASVPKRGLILAGYRKATPDDMARVLADVSWFATWVSRAECAMRRGHAPCTMSASAEYAMTAKLSCQLALAMNERYSHAN